MEPYEEDVLSYASGDSLHVHDHETHVYLNKCPRDLIDRLKLNPPKTYDKFAVSTIF